MSGQISFEIHLIEHNAHIYTVCVYIYIYTYTYTGFYIQICNYMNYVSQMQ